MRNGGGPACLRLRVVLNEQELAAINSRVLMSDWLYEQLNLWVDKHYRDRMRVKDLSDPQLLAESRTALDELTRIMGLGSIYPFQLV
jgi:succinylarginine dihydrolase